MIEPAMMPVDKFHAKGTSYENLRDGHIHIRTIKSGDKEIEANAGDMLVFDGVWSLTPPAWIVTDSGSLVEIDWRKGSWINQAYRALAWMHFERGCPVLEGK